MSTTKIQLESFITKSIFIFMVVMIFFTPLLFTSSTKEGYEFPKMIFVYIVGATIIFLQALKLIWTRQKFTWGDKVFGVFVIAYALSTLLSSHLYTSLFGYYSRFNGGLLSVLVFYGVYLAAINSLSKNDFKKLGNYLVVGTFPISLYAIVQHFDYGSTFRAYATLGQPNWLAAYLVMIIPINFTLFLNENIKNKQTLFWGTLLILNCIAIWATYSLSGIFGFMLVLSILIYTNFRKIINDRVKFAPVVLIVFAFMVARPGIFGSRLYDLFVEFKKEAIVKHVYAQEQNEDEYKVSDTGSIRKGLWRGTTKLITSNPKVFLIGSGPETFPYEFQKHRPAELNYSSEWDFILNKPHNYYLELWAQIGVLGLGLYLYAIYALLKTKDRILTPALLGFCIVNFFGWPTVATALLFWIYAGFLKVE